jgi:hypothetical protein
LFRFSVSATFWLECSAAQERSITRGKFQHQLPKRNTATTTNADVFRVVTLIFWWWSTPPLWREEVEHSGPLAMSKKPHQVPAYFLGIQLQCLQNQQC